MRQPDDFPIDPELLAELEAIDATLAGEPVDPRYAEVAEVALIVTAERPVIRTEFARELDQRVAQRFRPAPHQRGPKHGWLPRGRRGWTLWHAGGGLAAAAAATVAVVIVVGSGSGGPGIQGVNQAPGYLRAVKASPIAAAPTATVATTASAASAPSGRGSASSSGGSSSSNGASVGTASHAQAGSAHGPTFGPSSQGPLSHTGSGPGKTDGLQSLSPAPHTGTATPSSTSGSSGSGASRSTGSSSSGSSSTAGSSGAGSAKAAPSLPLMPLSAATSTPGGVQPQANGRRQIQSAQLTLMAAPSRVDDVAQEAFNAIGAFRGIVNHSNVTAGGPSGYAQIQISVPSANLAQLTTRLSDLPYAHVLSRTDQSQDVNDQYLVDVRRLGDAKAQRTALLKQLAAATTQTEIDSLDAQIHDNELAIQGDEKTLDSLNKRISYSQIELTINAGVVPVNHHHHNSSAGGFTLRKAVHDAGRVLVVVAGVALIALAAALPFALVFTLLAWITLRLRRHGRESALGA